MSTYDLDITQEEADFIIAKWGTEMPAIEKSRERAQKERLQAHRISDNEYRVYNIAKGTSYSVMRSASGIWRCDCPFMTKGSHVGTQGVCKHMTRVMDKLRGCGLGYCRAGKLCRECSK